MRHFEFQPEGVENCNVKAYIQTCGFSNEMQDRLLPAMIICPGGGYGMVSGREGEPVAKEYFAAGYHVFVLTYSVGERAKNFEPLCQLAATMAHVRKHADEWRIEKDKIAVCGFSAGGHLAGSLGTLYNEEKFLKVWNRTEDIRPNAMVLCYPVITADVRTHGGSIRNVSGAEEGSEEYRWFGLENHVDSTTPPTFLWHTANDNVVPVENSLAMAKALSAEKIPFELHIMPEGPHGMSTCTKEVGSDDAYLRRWVKWSVAWLAKMFGFEK